MGGSGEHRSMVDAVCRRLPGPVADVVESLRGKDVLLVAAGLAFYALVSVAPFCMLVFSGIGYLTDPGEARQVGDRIARLFPPEMGVARAFEAVAASGSRLGLGAVVALLWPATAYGSGLVRAFDRLSGRDQEVKGLRGRALALALLGLGPGLVLLGLVASYAGSTVAGEGWALVGGWLVALLVGAAASTGAALAVYRLFSPVHLSWSGLAPAAAAAGAAISVVSLAFVVYLELATDFEHRYATSGLAAVVLLALWLFVANTLLLVGYQVALQRSKG